MLGHRNGHLPPQVLLATGPDFSLHPAGVEQDLWSTFWFYNEQSACLLDWELAKQARTKDRKYCYQDNRNVTASLIKRWLPTLFLDGVQRWRARAKVLLDELLHHLEPYKPRPSRVRKRRIMRSQDRHALRTQLSLGVLMAYQGRRSRARAASRPDGGTMY